MIKHKKLLSRLIIPSAAAATAVVIFNLFLLKNFSFKSVLIIIVLIFLMAAIVTIVEYLIFSKQIEKGERKESDFMLRWERRKLNKELSQDEHSEDSDTPES